MLSALRAKRSRLPALTRQSFKEKHLLSPRFKQATKEVCSSSQAGYLRAVMFEEGLFTLAKIITTLVVPMGVIPVLFLLWPGADTSEPEEVFDTD